MSGGTEGADYDDEHAREHDYDYDDEHEHEHAMWGTIVGRFTGKWSIYPAMETPMRWPMT
jgi:hypothetical protein